MAVLLGNFVVSGNPTRHLGYFDAPPGEPSVIEFEEQLLAKNDTIKVTPVALPFVYLKHETMPEYPGPGLHIHWMEVEGPLAATWPTECYRRVFGDVDPKKGTLADAERLLRELLPRAFRRPVAEGEEKPFVELVAASLESGQPFEASLRAGIKAVLASPKFLYLRESSDALDDYALASRLSYFLWSTMPDDELFALAEQGKLHDRAELQRQFQRLLADPRSDRFCQSFASQWLNLRKVGMFPPDKQLYPDYDQSLEDSMIGETVAFFREVLTSGLTLREFLQSDWTMVNSRLAQFYNLPDVGSGEFQRVVLMPDSHRGGLLTQASILSLTSDGTRHRPVHRGKWVSEAIFGKSPPPPPANVDPIPPNPVDSPKATLRMKLEAHIHDPKCASCHKKIDPLGLAFENYDAIGRWRTTEAVEGTGANPEVDPSGSLPDGRSYRSPEEFKDRLLSDIDNFNSAFIEKLATFGLRRTLSFDDRDELASIAEVSR
ncbi:MAG: hypothetical protein B7Z55_10775, partial [Planctomycetales bacterium 12-60-4]